MSDRTLPPVATTTGLAPLPDIGTLKYNTVEFSVLFRSSIDAGYEQDNAGLTVKWVKYTLDVEGVVTLPQGQQTIDNPMATLRALLSQDAGALFYTGRGFANLNVNTGRGQRDLNWGPKPEIMHFQPLGGGLAAMVHWRVTTWISELSAGEANVLQFNEDISISYDEECYTTLSIKGTLEIGMTRRTVNARNFATTVDTLRQNWMSVIFASIDRRRYRITKRNFPVSRDNRVMEWEFNAEELPPTVMPFAAPVARGSFRFQPQKKGVGHVQWLCSLRCTYTIEKRFPRRTAWFHFVTLLWYRMLQSAVFGFNQNQPVAVQNAINFRNTVRSVLPTTPTPANAIHEMNIALRTLEQTQRRFIRNTAALLISVSGDEGTYLDAKSVTFEAQWRLFCTLDKILLSAGFWQYPGMRAGTSQPNYDFDNNVWALSMRDIMGWKGQLRNSLNAAGNAIIDFGSSRPPPGGLFA